MEDLIAAESRKVFIWLGREGAWSSTCWFFYAL